MSDLEAAIEAAWEARDGVTPASTDVRAIVDQALNLLFDGKSFTWFDRPRLETTWTHGAGCTFSACITAELAKHGDVPSAVQTAGDFVHAALVESFPLNRHVGAVYHKAMAKLH